MYNTFSFFGGPSRYIIVETLKPPQNLKETTNRLTITPYYTCVTQHTLQHIIIFKWNPYRVSMILYCHVAILGHITATIAMSTSQVSLGINSSAIFGPTKLQLPRLPMSSAGLQQSARPHRRSNCLR